MTLIVEGSRKHLDIIRQRFRSLGVKFTLVDTKEQLPPDDKSDKQVKQRQVKKGKAGKKG